jgi:2'-5' RNA ligase
VRLFVALRPPGPALRHLAAALPVRSAGTDRWHLTLAFLGELGDRAPLRGPLRAAARTCRPLELRLEGSGAFRGSGAVWVGLGGEVDALLALQAAVAGACRTAGVPLEERPYRPHLTVGRRPALDPAALASYAGPAWTAHEVELVRSHLGRPVRHEVLDRFPLRS